MKCGKSRQRGQAAFLAQKLEFTNADTVFESTSPTLNARFLLLHTPGEDLQVTEVVP